MVAELGRQDPAAMLHSSLHSIFVLAMEKRHLCTQLELMFAAHLFIRDDVRKRSKILGLILQVGPQSTLSPEDPLSRRKSRPIPQGVAGLTDGACRLIDFTIPNDVLLMQAVPNCLPCTAISFCNPILSMRLPSRTSHGYAIAVGEVPESIAKAGV